MTRFMQSFMAILLMSLSIGCSFDARIKALDAITGEPISGIKVERWFWRAGALEKTVDVQWDLGTTDANGEIVIMDIPKGGRTEIWFSKEGYQDGAVVAGHYEERSGNHMFVQSPITRRFWMSREAPNFPIGSLVIIPMHKGEPASREDDPFRRSTEHLGKWPTKQDAAE